MGGKSYRTRGEGRVGGGSRREVSLAEPAGSGGWVDCVCLSFILYSHVQTRRAMYLKTALHLSLFKSFLKTKNYYQFKSLC